MLSTEALIEIAKNSDADQHKCAAAVYDDRGRLIATGWNQPSKSHPLQAEYAKKAGFEKRIFLHAEIASLVKARGAPHTLQIVRIGPKEYPKPSYPCPICKMAAIEAGVKEIIYTDKNGEERKEEL